MVMAGRRWQPHRLVHQTTCLGQFSGSPYLQSTGTSRLQPWNHIEDIRKPLSLPSHFQPYAQEVQGWRKGYRASSKRNQTRGGGGSSEGFLSRLFSRLVKLVGGVLTISVATIVGAPYFLSWPVGLDTVLYLINLSIPGSLSVESASLGWRQPVSVEGVVLKGTDKKVVLSVPKFQTSAHLWSLVACRTGLGDTIVTAPTLDLRKDPATGQPYFDLALSPIEKLRVTNPYVKKNFTVLPSADVAWTAKVRAPGGDLEVLNGRVTIPGDVAAVLGSNLLLDVAIGRHATKESNALREGKKGHFGKTPVLCSLWSHCAHLEALAYWNLAKRRMELLQPMKAEMDLSPALVKFYLARINPLLGEIVGPAIGRDDLPDVTMHVTPAQMVWPADEYFIRVEPMKVVLAKGQFLDGVLSLLSRRDLERGSRQITMQTSAIEANVHLGGNLACSRVDLLIADKVHVATWGVMDHIHETMRMTLAIPGKSLRDLLGLARVTPDYHLKIPINGTFDRPQVDWMAAGRGITQLTIQQKLGRGLLSSFVDQFDDTDPVVPGPVGDLPWATN